MDIGSEGTLVRGDTGSEQHLAGGDVSGMPGPSARRLRPPPLRGGSARPAWAPTWPPAAAGSRATSQPSVRSPPWTQSPCWRRAGRATARRNVGAAAVPSRLRPAPWRAEGSARSHAKVCSSWYPAAHFRWGELQSVTRPVVGMRMRGRGGPGTQCGEPGPLRTLCRCEDAWRRRRGVSGSPAFHTNLSLAGAAPAQLVRDPWVRASFPLESPRGSRS